MEVLVSIAVLTTGLVFIYKAFFLSLDYITHLRYRLHAAVLLDDKLAELRRDFIFRDEVSIDPKDYTRSLALNNREILFQFLPTYHTVDGLADVSQLDLTLTWQERERVVRLSRSAYISRDQK